MSSASLASSAASGGGAAAVRAKREIAWSPFSSNEFVVGGTDLRFYSLSYKHGSTLLRRPENAPLVASQVKKKKKKKKQKKTKKKKNKKKKKERRLISSHTRNTKVDVTSSANASVGDQKWLTLQLLNAEVTHIRCVAWSPPTYSPVCVALGRSNGRVSIASRSTASQKC
jgi:hypothetical protein